MKPKAVYLHIPFCSHKCHYCDFTAYVVDGQPVDDYLDALAVEMEITVNETPPDEIESIFVGGGTPTVLNPRQMERFLDSIRTYFPNWSSQIEFTVEANPGTITSELLAVMRKGGVNRLSFGAQTFRDDLLVRIGRTHNAEEIEKSFFLAREQGFRNLSLDLIFGLPTQTVEDVRESLYRSLALQPKHFSCYSLKVEKGTVFHYLYERDQLPLPSEEAELEMYQQIRKILAENGYYQYEVSNFSIPGYESKHNITYWKNEPYYGLGAGAHGYVGTIRHANIKGIPAYLEALQKGERPIAEQYEVSPQEDRENFMILGLRLTKGIEKDRFLQRFKVPIEAYYQEELERLCQRGLINITEKHIFLTESGLLYGNDVFAEFLKD